MWAKGLAVFSNDDSVRAILAQAWTHNHLFAPGGSLWLPLPFYLYGSWHWIVGRHFHWTLWYLPAGATMTGLAATMIGWAGVQASRPGQNRPQAGWGLLGLAVLAPLMIRDNWRIASTPLSEPPYLMFYATALALLAWKSRHPRPGWRFWTCLAASLVAIEMTRFEGMALAFAAWAVACLLDWLDGPRRAGRAAKLLGAGAIVLGLFPLAWMAYNRATQGASLSFFSQSLESSLHNSSMSSFPASRRIGFILRWIREQSPALLAATIGGLWVGRRRRELLPIAAMFLAALAADIYVALANVIGVGRPSRYVLGIVWSCIPPAIVLGDKLWSGGQKTRLGLLLGIAATIGLGLPRWVRADWGGLTTTEVEVEALASIERLARVDGYAIVFRHADDEQLINIARFHCDPDNVTFIEQYSKASPVRGKFLYLHRPDNRIPGHKAGEGFGLQYDYFSQMPPTSAR
jgi:hypothetical protein